MNPREPDRDLLDEPVPAAPALVSVGADEERFAALGRLGVATTPSKVGSGDELVLVQQRHDADDDLLRDDDPFSGIFSFASTTGGGSAVWLLVSPQRISSHSVVCDIRLARLDTSVSGTWCKKPSRESNRPSCGAEWAGAACKMALNCVTNV